MPAEFLGDFGDVEAAGDVFFEGGVVFGSPGHEGVGMGEAHFGDFFVPAGRVFRLFGGGFFGFFDDFAEMF